MGPIRVRRLSTASQFFVALLRAQLSEGVSFARDNCDAIEP